ncbi:MAG: response regulator transcription factor [Patescibacteria group bacterium]|nr:response regulator transcription factor [Patescibacteria group bacterium]
MKILVVEDEESIREVIKKYLQLAGFDVLEAASGEVALLKFNDSVDLVILDLNLPNRDGLEVCRGLRKKSQVPIIMVTARTDELDELKGLGLGADDYIKKPFSPKVLVARIKSMLRRSKFASDQTTSLTLNEKTMTVHRGQRSIPLTTTQFNILRALLREPGKVFTRSELLSIAGEDKRLKLAMERTIDAHIKTIRKLIGDDPHNPKFIKTIIGTGYKYTNEI